MNCMVVYHWWAEPDDPPVWANHRSPIILSIATLRACNPDIPIVVLDASASGKTPHNYSDWGDWRQKLNFKVCRIQPSMMWAAERINGWKHLSRIDDVFQFADHYESDNTIIYCDSDVFWLKNPLPLNHDSANFCFDGWNTGFFYFNRHHATSFRHIFSAYTTAAIYSEELRFVIGKNINYDNWYGVWDEQIITYMKSLHPELFSIIAKEEHFAMRDMGKADLDKVKMFHCNGTMVANPVTEYPGLKQHSRGLTCLIFEEFYDKLLGVLSEEDLNTIFTNAERSKFSKRFKLQDASKLRADASGHYRLLDLYSEGRTPTFA